MPCHFLLNYKRNSSRTPGNPGIQDGCTVPIQKLQGNRTKTGNPGIPGNPHPRAKGSRRASNQISRTCCAMSSWIYKSIQINQILFQTFKSRKPGFWFISHRLSKRNSHISLGLRVSGLRLRVQGLGYKPTLLSKFGNPGIQDFVPAPD